MFFPPQKYYDLPHIIWTKCNQPKTSLYSFSSCCILQKWSHVSFKLPPLADLHFMCIFTVVTGNLLLCQKTLYWKGIFATMCQISLRIRIWSESPMTAYNILLRVSSLSIVKQSQIATPVECLGVLDWACPYVLRTVIWYW